MKNSFKKFDLVKPVGKADFIIILSDLIQIPVLHYIGQTPLDFQNPEEWTDYDGYLGYNLIESQYVTIIQPANYEKWEDTWDKTWSANMDSHIPFDIWHDAIRTLEGFKHLAEKWRKI